MDPLTQSESVGGEGMRLPRNIAATFHAQHTDGNPLVSAEHSFSVACPKPQLIPVGCSEGFTGTPRQRHPKPNNANEFKVASFLSCEGHLSAKRASFNLSPTRDAIAEDHHSAFKEAGCTERRRDTPGCADSQTPCTNSMKTLPTVSPGGLLTRFGGRVQENNSDGHRILSCEVSGKEHARGLSEADLRPTVGRVRRKNFFLMIVLLTITFLLAVAGGIGVGYVNMYYTTLTHRHHLESSDRAILNTSTMMLKSYHRALQDDAQNLISFVRLSMITMDIGNSMKLNEALSSAFFNAWRTWMFRSSVTIHSVYIPMCSEAHIDSSSCPTIALRVECTHDHRAQECYFMRSKIFNSTWMAVHRVDFSDPDLPRIGEFVMDVPLQVNYVHGDSEQHFDYYFDPRYGATVDDPKHMTLVLRHQEKINDHIVICDTGSSFDRWFNSFERGLQKKTDSYSMLLRDDGAILAYGYDDVKSSDHSAELPCNALRPSLPSKNCGRGKAAVLDRMVNILKKTLSGTDFIEGVLRSCDSPMMTEMMDNYIIVYQDFLRFQWNYTRPHSVFFAAYAVPLDVSLGREGIVQIIICVIIIIICIFLLGGVAMVAVNQMLQVVEVISKLSTHAAMYDTEGMRSVLDSQKPGLLARVITSADVINNEFQLIFTNLNAYRPFLPQSLLTKGNCIFAGDSLVPSSVACGDDTGDDLPTDNKELCHERAHALALSDALARTVVNPIENTLLLQRGFHPTKSTVLVVGLSNVALSAGDSVDLVSVFVQTAVNHAVQFSGVVETIEFQKVMISFNAHFPVPRHQEKACLCALSMREDFRDSGCIVCMGIASGYNYVGTTGTEQQKARVIVGESVVVAEALTHLGRYLGSSILATDQVVFEALVVAVAVDVMQLYYQHDHQWVSYSVSEIIGNQHAVLSADMQLVKSVFKLVRYRQAEEALKVVRDYVVAASERQEKPSWPVRRLHALVESQQELIISGYGRRRQLWQALEGEELIINHLSETSKSYDSRQPHFPRVSISATTEAPFTSSSANGITALSEVGLVPSETFTACGEAALARALVGEQSRLITTRRQSAPVSKACLSDNALFSVFMLTHNEDDEDRQNGSSTLVPKVRSTDNMTNDSKVNSNEESGRLPRSAHTLPSQRRDGLCVVEVNLCAASQLSPLAASHSMDCARRSSGITTTSSNSRLCSAHECSFHRAPRSLQSPTTHLDAFSGFGVFKEDRERRCSVGDSVADTSARDVGPAGDSAPRHGGEHESSSLRALTCYALPQRVVSVSGQVFHRTTQLLGRGSFGEVYLVISETGALGAMKAFPLNNDNAHQLIREVETLSQMRHENIVGYDCCAVQDNFFFIICEYMAAGTLGSLIQRLRVVPERAARKYARDMLFGLIYLHQHSWLHCDIKPENILIACDGTCKLADFGVASLQRSLMDAVSVRGTPRFSAPEAILGTWTEKADIYSFGITVAQMMMGVHPWYRYGEPDHLFVAHYAGEIRHSLQTGLPCMMQPELPTNLQDKELQCAIHRCCEFDPALRPTAEELVTLLS
ncbi:hypothetical protein JKF63_00085 [Porcisia hertigi]|uniref:Protein kinase domain-containing protein n=1 Tax=Porcisia hertigi TaxID=2761500 RepID=A0A836KWS0_9TRYP|nr:hypothetical protein JKF63_00085 [Porcisia hertigi]